MKVFSVQGKSIDDCKHDKLSSLEVALQNLNKGTEVVFDSEYALQVVRLARKALEAE